ncbi:hypothetical protein BKA67DRAFT_524621 [Truncatella angustata]|uniref:Uncharacterized protein n=1 Tax=Truncatella angustata TaxID=152316 RepID=A0A9P8RIY8_9PEZI|nr:uncharacterized protein BKA67DRAFT_524621 [Truncatella angustata]KAH6646709.1 hypothetical protein BKA67DRAFT_524621 [Truncatella angustata]
MASSRESTATLGRNPEGASNQDSAPEEVPGGLLDDISDQRLSKRLIVAVDFGTTYSCVSFVALEAGEAPDYLPLDRIETIGNYPNDLNFDSKDEMENQVPTELMYPLNRNFRDQDDLPPLENNEGITGVGTEDEGDGSIPGQPIPITDANENGEDMDMDGLFESDSLQWGYSVHEARSIPAIHINPNNRPLSRFKLLLDESPMTRTIRDDLNQTIGLLKRKRIIQKPLQVIADFLTCLLRHTKTELVNKGYDDNWKVEMVLCVPAIWTQKGCRNMQTAMAYAMEKARFIGADFQNNSIENLFIVSEPEAAAAYVLASDPDIQPGGGLFGSSFLNEGFQQMLSDLLKDEQYLETGFKTIDGIIERIMVNEFEYRVKRSFDLRNVDSRRGVKSFPVSGLLDNPAKRFSHECTMINLDTRINIKPIFVRLLEGIAAIMEDQINKALQKGCRVEKVILQGGFAASKSLSYFIEDRLKRFNEEFGHNISPKRSNNTLLGAEKIGEILVDFTFLREQGLIQPIEPIKKPNGKTIGTRHYRVVFTMAIRVVDRDLQCYALYSGQVVKRCRINIASAFRPGVK